MSGVAVVRLRQHCHATFRALTGDQPAIILVRSGAKAIGAPDGALVMGEGDLGVMPAHRPLTVENRPDGQVPYQSTAIIIPDLLVERLRRDGLPDGTPFQTSRADRAISAFHLAAERLSDPSMPERMREHAISEVILWLAEEGIGFGRPVATGLTQRLRGLIASDPSRAWRAGEVGRILAVSEATLRRRLQTEGVNFQSVLIDVRMSWALGQLQATDRPVNHIALDAGYDSASRFAIRFRQRFGVSPTDIRGLAEGHSIERIGTANERIGTPVIGVEA